MANLRTIQFLRNAQMYASLEAAKSALNAKASELLDGSPVVGRYTVQTGESASDTEIRTILGIVANGTISFFNNTEEIDNVLQNLDFGPEGGSSSSVIDFIQQTDGKISATTKNVGQLTLAGYAKGESDAAVDTADTINAAISKLENQIDAEETARANQFLATSAASVADDNKVITDVTQTNGVISATASNITGVKLTGYTEAAEVADIADTDTLGQALGKLQKTIHEMDKNADAVDGQVVTTVSEADGVVSETKANVKDLQLGGYEKTNDTGDIASADTINVALSKLENKAAAITINDENGSINVTPTVSGTDISVHIKTGENVIKLDGEGGGIYTNISLSSITPSSDTVKEEYQLTATDGTKLGESIKIYKDSSIVSITYITDPTDAHYQNLEYVSIDASGNTQTEYVDISSLVLEAEFGSGITVTDHVAHGVVDPSSESFFTVGADGFKVAGISAFVQSEIESLDATGGTQAIATGKHVAVEVVEADGKITDVTVVEDDIANASDLTQEIADREAGDTALSDRLGTGVTSANTATAQFAALSGDTASTSADTSVEGAKRYADAILANSVAGLDADESGSTAHVTVGVLEVDGVISAVTVSEDNIANADDLTELSGKTVATITSENGSISASINDAVGCKTYNIETDSSKIKLSSFTESSGTTDVAPTDGDTINEALAKIYSAAKHHHLTSTNAGISAATTVDGTSVTLTLDDTSSLATNNNDTDSKNALMITDNGLFLSKDWDCGTF